MSRVWGGGSTKLWLKGGWCIERQVYIHSCWEGEGEVFDEKIADIVFTNLVSNCSIFKLYS